MGGQLLYEYDGQSRRHGGKDGKHLTQADLRADGAQDDEGTEKSHPERGPATNAHHFAQQKNRSQSAEQGSKKADGGHLTNRNEKNCVKQGLHGEQRDEDEQDVEIRLVGIQRTQ